ncbi:MAG: hypothetical protein AAB502_09345 [Chloroflexota bacterium]
MPVSARCQPFLSNMEAACIVDMMEKRVGSVTDIRASFGHVLAKLLPFAAIFPDTRWH